MKIVIPKNLREKTMRLYWESGEKWIQSLPEIIKKCEKIYEISIHGVYQNAYAGLVLKASRNKHKEDVVLKICHPQWWIHYEKEALRVFNGQWVAHLLGIDEDTNSLIIQHVTPWDMLNSLSDEKEATRIAWGLIVKMRDSDPQTKYVFPKVTDWIKVLEDPKTECIPEKLRKAATSICHDLYESCENIQLIHGDFHHENILFDEQKWWIAIDPLGVISDPVHNVGQYFMSYGKLCKKEVSVSLFEELGISFSETLWCDIRRIYWWAFVQWLITTGRRIKGGDTTILKELSWAEMLYALYQESLCADPSSH